MFIMDALFATKSAVHSTVETICGFKRKVEKGAYALKIPPKTQIRSITNIKQVHYIHITNIIRGQYSIDHQYSTVEN